METKLYVGNLPFDATEEELKTLFSEAGEVKSVVLIKDKFSGQSKGFGFVEMENQEGMQNALKTFESYSFKDRPLKVDVAKPKEDNRRPFDANRRGGGGGNRRGGGGGGGNRGGGHSDYNNRY
ncbi:RNA recognition motif domain-containing protein [Pelolinea submarina]|jgi:RNA recognition motif-containing protein|uniref:RNA recognition motif-containing protein n=1 Tax=Pelolinea submarina TaxID=913107 RepID=A0A347ZWC1_9CHLR|nr:RNA-binding protein [Pelolinea submarina]REG07301.1 RNA recognition motif-containing protein [Pelolinea submarina]BBB49602.1 RNA-binding protein [Pelolinea submarina]